MELEKLLSYLLRVKIVKIKTIDDEFIDFTYEIRDGIVAEATEYIYKLGFELVENLKTEAKNENAKIQI